MSILIRYRAREGYFRISVFLGWKDGRRLKKDLVSSGVKKSRRHIPVRETQSGYLSFRIGQGVAWDITQLLVIAFSILFDFWWYAVGQKSNW